MLHGDGDQQTLLDFVDAALLKERFWKQIEHEMYGN
jgi:hypothetical protein